MWQIMGAGAIGCLWAANIIQSGKKVHLITREQYQNTRLTYEDLQCNKAILACTHSTKLICNSSPILICVKASQVKQTLTQHLNDISPEQVIILMHNGMGTAEQVATLLPNNAIVCATTANASLLNAPLDIKQTGLGATYLGAFNQKAQAFSYLIKELNNALGNSHWCEDIKQKLWLKLLINACINPLTAIHQINNGQLIKHQYQSEIVQMIDEIVPILKAEVLLMDRSMLLNTVNKVIKATASNYSSMNRDIYFKRLTENEHINGYLIKKALQHDIETPLTLSYYQKIKELESHSLIQ